LALFGLAAARPSRCADVVSPCARIVSLSPSTTEILFALGLGDRVVGVTRFCNYPPEARERRRIGGYLDPNYEAIASLEPDLVYLLPEQERVKRFLDELDLCHVTVNNKSIADILGGIETIGETCGARHAARALVDSIAARCEHVRVMTEGRARPRVLIAVDHTEAGAMGEVYVAGPDTHYDELLRAAAAVNAYRGRRVDYPMLTAEGIIHCNPDVIIDIRPLLGDDPSRAAAAAAVWGTVAAVTAVKDGRVHILTGDHAVVPGPRFVELLEEMAKIIHPEIDWDER
jgi:iron complex transport system substrate-binding protein